MQVTTKARNLTPHNVRALRETGVEVVELGATYAVFAGDPGRALNAISVVFAYGTDASRTWGRSVNAVRNKLAAARRGGEPNVVVTETATPDNNEPVTVRPARRSSGYAIPVEPQDDPALTAGLLPLAGGDGFLF